MDALNGWVADLASPDRVWALVAAGGTGKTAVVERVVATMAPSAANVLVWSFYERPDADAFLRECNQFFLGEEEGSAGGMLERLLRGLRDGRPHLIVLDGLERVQEEAGVGRVRGELTDHTLKLLLRALVGGQGRTRALVTSRFPLVDLEDWSSHGYRDTRLDDLSPEAAVSVLRGWGVLGTEMALAQAAAQVGHHALSVAVVGSYLRSFAGGRIEAAAEFDLDAVTGEDPRAAKLARVLAFYAQRLPEKERELLARLSMFPRGVSLGLLGTLVEAGGEVAGLLANDRPRLLGLLNSLEVRGLVFCYASAEDNTWTAHPFLRDRFRQLLGCPAEQVYAVVADALGAGLDTRPDTYPSEPAELDRYERLIEATRLLGRVEEAFDLYSYGLGGAGHLAFVLGEYQRGYRILSGFKMIDHAEHWMRALSTKNRFRAAFDFALFAIRMGRLIEAWNLCRPNGGKEGNIAIYTDNNFAWSVFSSMLAHDLGELTKGQQIADRIRKEYIWFEGLVFGLPGLRAFIFHARGDVTAAEAEFSAMAQLRERLPTSSLCAGQARHHLDLGDLLAARALVNHGLDKATEENRNEGVTLFQELLARLALAEGNDPTAHLEAIRAWTSRTGEMKLIIIAHLLTARHCLATGDSQAALAEAELGLLHAETCGYGLIRIELLIALTRIRLAWPDPPTAIQVARLAHDLAAAPQCGYAWGEADAAQAWGEAYLANGEAELAKSTFRRALAVRQRIRHPATSETEEWIARIP